ncbi:hypothetical protein I6B53_08190 [Schaalia sp. 19OD2882]|uniref:hypothetical protein n=1 Tax=Schaalia sp. 19OD2882 TaxID=2794089 RepID=UPI001C1EB620|nr:hypothetical protein [Schaalia sp. 19OD2882]QWW19093.1 hypothetical protein I6B53_08190 [Schaalia sp. 19OD2882]
MGILADYFIAPDDNAAEAILDRVGGPSVADEETGAPALPCTQLDMDPAAQLTWVAMMSPDTAEGAASQDMGATIGIRNEGEVAVMRLSTAGRDALAALATNPDDPEAAEVLVELADPDEILEDGAELVALAVQAKQAGHPLYLWMAV